jgi:hypothetical protein
LRELLVLGQSIFTQPVLTWGDGDGLDVGDGRRTSEQPDISGERRLEPRLALFPLDRLDQSRLLSTNVRSGTPVQVDVEIVPGTTGVLADQARLVGLVDGLLNVGGFLVEFSSDVDVSYEVERSCGSISRRVSYPFDSSGTPETHRH